jgi:CRISPR-associated protein Cas5d
MNNWCLEVWGDYACFTRPEMKVERVSYDVMTPSAARGIFEAILWKPEIKWHIKRIEVLNPIQWISVRRNEVGKKTTNPTTKNLSGVDTNPMGIYIEEDRQQRAGLFLKDVKYRLHARFEVLLDNTNAHLSLETSQDKEKMAAKYAAMFERRVKKGQCFNRPYLGCREFSCYFKLIDSNDDLLKPIQETRDLGWMLYDMDFTDSSQPMPMFFNPKMENGVVNTDILQVEVRR